jgi:hypothetical protein
MITGSNYISNKLYRIFFKDRVIIQTCQIEVPIFIFDIQRLIKDEMYFMETSHL